MREPETEADRLALLDLPLSRACRCGDSMDLREVNDDLDLPIATWDCRCGRAFACQVDPETREVLASEWQS